MSQTNELPSTPSRHEVVEMHADHRFEDLEAAVAALNRLDADGLKAVLAAVRRGDDRAIARDLARYRLRLRKTIEGSSR